MIIKFFLFFSVEYYISKHVVIICEGSMKKSVNTNGNMVKRSNLLNINQSPGVILEIQGVALVFDE